MNKKFIPGIVIAVVAVGFAAIVAAHSFNTNSTDKQVKGASTSQTSSKSQSASAAQTSPTSQPSSDTTTSSNDTNDMGNGGVPADQRAAGSNVLTAVSHPAVTSTTNQVASTPTDTSSTTGSTTSGNTDTTPPVTTGGTTTTPPTTTPTSTDCTAATRVNKPLTSGFTGGLVSLTFDDGLTSTYTNGLPLLHKYCFVSTQYMIADPLQNNASYQNDNGTNDYMTVDNAKQFLTAQNGVEGTEIGSHTVHHCDLANNQYTQTDDAVACPIPLSASQVTSELQNSKSYLESVFGTPITDFASPYGNYDENTLPAIYAAGYASHRSTDGGFNVYGSIDLDDVWVQNVESTTSVAQVEAWVTEAQTNNEWLVLVYHDVANSSDPAQVAGTYGVTTTNLDQEFAFIQQSGIKVGTMAEAVAASGAPALNGQWDYAQYYAGLTFPADKSTATSGSRTTTPAASTTTDSTTSDDSSTAQSTTSDQPATTVPASDSTTDQTQVTPAVTPVTPEANTQSNASGL